MRFKTFHSLAIANEKSTFTLFAFFFSFVLLTDLNWQNDSTSEQRSKLTFTHFTDRKSDFPTVEDAPTQPNPRANETKRNKQANTHSEMGRLSAYAKNRILKLRFKKNKRIIHIVDILKKDDNIKVSRQAVSTFLKKYLETNSIYDKPRTGRKRKLTQEEIQLIGQVTRLNRDITARAIKEYLNLNVSTYTILRATKLFEWNKINPNSNDSKKAAALERQLNVGLDAAPR